jgi:UDP-glucose 4-epimerase
VLGYGAPTGWTPDYLPLDENHPARPWNTYAVSKQLVEELVAMFARQSTATVFGAFRPCFVLSPGEWAGEPTQQGHTVVDRLNDPSLAAVSLFNYVDARDAADFVLAWLERAGPAENGETFFVGAADALAAEPLATLLPRFLPSASGAAAALVGEAPAFSSAKAERLLGWTPKRSWRSELTTDQRALLLPSPVTATATTTESSQP